jgi:hypothetical protein
LTSNAGPAGAPASAAPALVTHLRTNAGTAADDAVTKGDATTLAAARCGLIEVAGKAAGAAFVGTVVAAIVLSEALRLVNEGYQYETVSLNLRTPEGLSTYRNPDQKPVDNPGYVEADPT